MSPIYKIEFWIHDFIPGARTLRTSANAGSSLDEPTQAKFEASDFNLESSSQPFTSVIEEKKFNFRPQTY